MGERNVGIWGSGVAAGAYIGACQALDWNVAAVASRNGARTSALANSVGAAAMSLGEFRDAEFDLKIACTPPNVHRWLSGSGTVLTSPFVSTLADADELVELDEQGAFGWPLATAPVIQELFRHIGEIGVPTNLSSYSSRPVPTWGRYVDGGWFGGALQFAGGEQLALVLLTSKILGLGTPTAVEAEMTLGAGGVDESADVKLRYASGLAATLHTDWRATTRPTAEFQVAGNTAVLRTDLLPTPHFERNGDAVPLPPRVVRSDQERPLHDSGVIDMLRTVSTAFQTGAPLAHAFTYEFGRQVTDVLAGAYASAGRHGAAVSLPFAGDRSKTPKQLLNSSVSGQV